MAGETVLEATLRHDRWIVGVSLAGITLLAWVYLSMLAEAMASMKGPGGWRAFMALMPMGRWGLPEYALGFAMWAIMMIGMMIPSAAPTIVLYSRVARRAQPRDRPLACTAAFVAGYLLTWSAFSLAAATFQGVLVASALVTETMTSGSRVLAGTLLATAGLYQWTPLKHACLAHCRSPIHFLSQHWRPGRVGALRMGIEHGTYCIGCCWALMGVLFAVGIMNLLWIAAIATVALVEKVVPFGMWSRRVTGALLVAWAIVTLFGLGAS